MLAYHTCVHGDDPAANPDNPTFGAVIENTSLPHVLEHLIIDEQVRNAETPRPNSAPVTPSDPAALAPSPAPFTDATFVGTTEWLDEAAGLARVEVNFTDDLVALRALRSALAFLNGILDGKAV